MILMTTCLFDMRIVEPRPGWRYVPAEQTDILAKFKELGWVPPTEQKENNGQVGSSVTESNWRGRQPSEAGQDS